MPMYGINNATHGRFSIDRSVVAPNRVLLPSTITMLFEPASDHDAAVPQVADGWYRTTPAVYRAEPMATRETLYVAAREFDLR